MRSVRCVVRLPARSPNPASNEAARFVHCIMLVQSAHQAAWLPRSLRGENERVRGGANALTHAPPPTFTHTRVFHSGADQAGESFLPTRPRDGAFGGRMRWCHYGHHPTTQSRFCLTLCVYTPKTRAQRVDNKT